MSGNEILSSINKTSGSGIDIASLVENLVAVETQVSKSNIAKDKASIETKISELGKLSSQLSGLKGTMDGYTSATQFAVGNSHQNNFQVTVTDPQAVEESKYNINVSKLAKNQIIHIDFAADVTSSTNLGAGTIEVAFGSWSDGTTKTFTSGGRTETVNIVQGANTIEGLRTALNAIDGIYAAVVSNGQNNSLILRSETGAAAGFKITNNISDASSPLANVGFDITGQDSSDLSKLSQASQDAEINIDGVSISSSTNILKNTIYGAELSLQAPMTAGEVGKVSISRDQATFRTDLENLIAELNTVKTDIKELTSRGVNGSQGGPLAGDTRATQIALRLEKITTTAIEGFGEPLYLSQLGVRTELDGTLSFDEAAFQRSMQNTTIQENFREIIFGIGVKTDAGGLKVTSDQNKIPNVGIHDYQIEAIENGQYQISIGGQSLISNPDSDGNIVSRHTEGAFKGLTFTFGNDLLTAEGSGTFEIGVGFVPNFKSYIEGLLGPNGALAKHTETYEENLIDLQAQEQSLEEKQESLTDRYNLEFGRMETAISSLKRQGDYITSLMDMWTNYNK